MSTDFLSILITNTIEEAQRIRRDYAHKNIGYKEASEGMWALKNVLRGVRYDSKRTCTPEEAQAISDAVETIDKIYHQVCDTYLRIQDASQNIMRELRREA